MLQQGQIYETEEVAKMLRVSKETVRRMFEDEVGVISLPSATRKKLPHSTAIRLRRYRKLRIPAYVLRRVIERYKLAG